MTDGTCRICGEISEGQPFEAWGKDTFTNYDLLHPGEIICTDCLFWFGQKSAELQQRMGKDKPQKMQNYSHFLLGDANEWQPVSKGNKAMMARLLLTPPFPRLAAIAVSGQKHVAFRARRNGPDQRAGWVQFEEQALWVEPTALAALLAVIEELYTAFSKDEIGSGHYNPHRIHKFGTGRWHNLEWQIKPVRQAVLFQLALYLAQRREDENDTNDNAGDGGDAAQDYLAGDTARLQEPLPYDNLGAVRKRNQGGGVHVESGEVYQLDLLSFTGGVGPDGGGAGGCQGDTQDLG